MKETTQASLMALEGNNGGKKVISDQERGKYSGPGTDLREGLIEMDTQQRKTDHSHELSIVSEKIYSKEQ